MLRVVLSDPPHPPTDDGMEKLCRRCRPIVVVVASRLRASKPVGRGIIVAAFVESMWRVVSYRFSLFGGINFLFSPCYV